MSRASGNVCLADVRCSDFSKRLNLSREDGEKWIVSLIRDSRLGIDAKIDLQAVRTVGPPRNLAHTSPRRTCFTSRDPTKHPQQPSSRRPARSLSDLRRFTMP